MVVEVGSCFDSMWCIRIQQERFVDAGRFSKRARVFRLLEKSCSRRKRWNDGLGYGEVRGGRQRVGRNGKSRCEEEMTSEVELKGNEEQGSK